MVRKQGFYERYVKRILDIVCALAALIVFSWLYIIIAVSGSGKAWKPCAI